MDSKSPSFEQRRPYGSPAGYEPKQQYGNPPKHWLREILAIIASVASLAGLAFLLAAFDKQPIFDFHGVTLNTLVSVLSTLSKAALTLCVAESVSQWKWILFARGERRLIDFERIDWASRGLRGSWILLWMRNSSFTLRLGAVVAFLAVFADPFAQQLIQFRQDVVWSAVPALDLNGTMVPLAERYSKGNLIRMLAWPFTPNSVERHQNLTEVDCDFSVQSSILYGLAQPSVSRIQQQLPVACASSNCTWPSFESLAICSICNRVDSDLKRFRSQGLLYLEMEHNNNGARAGNGTGYILPNGLIIDNLDDEVGVVGMTTLGTMNPGETVSLQHLDAMIWSMSFIKRGKIDMNDTSGRHWPDIPVTATECALFYCVNRYQPAIVNGVLNETTSRVDKVVRNPASWQPAVPSFLDSSFLAPEQLSTLAFDPTLSYVPHTDLQLTTPAGGVFNVSEEAVYSIAAYLKKTFATETPILYTPRTVEGDEQPSGRVTGYYSGYAGPGAQGYYRPSTMQTLHAAGADLDGLFAAVAASMSNAVRAGADGAARAPGGRMGRPATSYRIEWPWMALQGAVVMAGVVILVATVWASGDPAVPVWKSSALAVLSRGPWVAGVLDGAAEVREMQRDASGRAVELF